MVHRDLITTLAAAYKLPAVYPFRYFVTVGGLSHMGPNWLVSFSPAAGYVDRILKGEKPADLGAGTTEFDLSLISRPRKRSAEAPRDAARPTGPPRRTRATSWASAHRGNADAVIGLLADRALQRHRTIRSAVGVVQPNREGAVASGNPTTGAGRCPGGPRNRSATTRGRHFQSCGTAFAGCFREMPEKPATGEPVALDARSVRFYEVYWADLLMGERVSGTFDFDEVSTLAWFPLFNQINRAYAKEPYPLWSVFRHSVVLPLAGFALLMVYSGLDFLATLWGAIREMPERTARPARVHGKDIDGARRLFAEKGRDAPTVMDRLLDEYAADVFNYINSAGDTFSPKRNVSEGAPRHVYREIIGQFYNQLVCMRNDGCRSIHIVAHSLGTVVMYHALRGHGLDDAPRADRPALSEAMASIEHLYTIGSPLEKIRFFWPDLQPETNLAGERPIAWDNFVSYFDPVAGMLRAIQRVDAGEQPPSAR